MDDTLFLGIDCGTGKVALVILDGSGDAVHVAHRAHDADLDVPAGLAEQDAGRILACVDALLAGIPPRFAGRIAGIGLTGQMHGVVLHDAQLRPISPLVTWQDRRPLVATATGRRLHPGYGMATLAWWAAHGGIAGRSATIHGLLAARLCALDRSPIDPTDAQAWGGLDPLPGVPPSVLPRAVGHGACVGRTRGDGILPAGLPVTAPLGDNQASIRGSLDDPARQLAFTIGTGCQLSAVVARGTVAATGAAEIRPFSDDHDLLVAAPLAGGAAWRWLATTAQGWCRDLGLQPQPLEDVYARLDAAGLAAEDHLDLTPHFSGERHAPGSTATLAGLRLDNGSLGEIARALAHGIARNARDQLGDAACAGRTAVIASGNALRRSALLRREAGRAFGLPVTLSPRQEEAAVGAALVAREADRAPLIT